MLLTEYVSIKICSKNVNHFKSKGYECKVGNTIMIKVEDLSPQSNKLVDVKCDKCGNTKTIKYQTYMLNTKFGETYYACSEKCAWDKNRKTNLKKYGVEVVTQNENVKNKYKNTCINKYGVENYSQTKEFKNKYKETMMIKYGVENAFQSEEIKKKALETNIAKYGVPYTMQRLDMKEKYLLGDKNTFYIHGNGSSNLWVSNEAKMFKSSIFRNSRVCVVCSNECREMQIHHLYSRNTHPELIFDVNNVVVICKKCHTQFHNLYGYGNNTKSQFYQFLIQNKESQTTIERVFEGNSFKE